MLEAANILIVELSMNRALCCLNRRRDVPRTWASVAKARTVLGWERTRAVSFGSKPMIHYSREGRDPLGMVSDSEIASLEGITAEAFS